MIKKCYRFFGNRTAKQQKWLNAMSHEGYRLIGTGKISYEFERCRPNEYLSYQDEKAYRNSLEEKGYKVFYKNINLNYSIGKYAGGPLQANTAESPRRPATSTRNY